MPSAYEPALFPVGPSNQPGGHTFQLEITYGASDPASYRGRYLELGNTATGKLTIYFPRTYARVTGFRWGWTKCAAGAVYFPVILTNSIATASARGGGSLVMETRTEAGVATDPASGDILIVEFDVTYDAADAAASTTFV